MVIVEYDREWPSRFERIKSVLARALSCAAGIEHVGSTSIPGMCGKPIIDIDVVIPDNGFFETATLELAGIGYVHVGDQGIAGREVFKRAPGDGHEILDKIAHHLYVCAAGCEELRRHILFRDYLRECSEAVKAYRSVKKEILRRYGDDDRAAYVKAKEEEYRWFFESIIDMAKKKGGGMYPVRNSAKAIIIRDNKLLCIKLTDGQGFYYILPGGGQEKYETFAAAVKRECREELGAEVAVGRLLFIREYIAKNHEFRLEDDNHQVEFMFECALLSEPDSTNATNPDKGQNGMEWIDLADTGKRVYPKVLLERIVSQYKELYWGDVN